MGALILRACGDYRETRARIRERCTRRYYETPTWRAVSDFVSPGVSSFDVDLTRVDFLKRLAPGVPLASRLSG